MAVITVKNLSKDFKVKQKEKGLKGSLKSLVKPKYKIIKAVKNISFSVEKGEMIAFIGPNGAGKSTSIKMMTGILYPNKGEIDVLGLDPRKDRKRLAYEIGCVFGQKEQLWTHLTPYDNFKFFGAIYDIPDSVVEKKINEMIEKQNAAVTTMATVAEPARETPLIDTADVVVAGGGIAGCAAALAAARNGASVLLIEKQTMLGGLATAGLITYYLPLCDGEGRQMSYGIAEEFLRLSVRHYPEADIPESWKKNGGLDPDYAEARRAVRYETRFSPGYR